MLDINLIRTQPDVVKKAFRDRQNPELVEIVDQALALDTRRRDSLKEVEALKAQRNTVSKEIGRMKDAAEREAKIAEQRTVDERIAALDAELRQIEADLEAAVSALPNLPDPRTPFGTTEDDNVVLRTIGEPRAFDFAPSRTGTSGRSWASSTSSAASS